MIILGSLIVALASGPTHSHIHVHAHADSSEELAYQKPGAPIRFSHKLSATPEIGRSVTLSVTMKTDVTAGTLAIDLSGTDGLDISSAPSAFTLDETGQVSFDVRARPNVAGAHYVNVVAELCPDAGPASSRAHAIRVATEGMQTKPSPMMKMQGGEAIIQMPAIEIIR